MGYNTTGKSHRNGISGEESTKILIESGRLTSFGQSPAVIKRGGTPVSYTHLTLPTKRIV